MPGLDCGQHFGSPAMLSVNPRPDAPHRVAAASRTSHGVDVAPAVDRSMSRAGLRGAGFERMTSAPPTSDPLPRSSRRDGRDAVGMATFDAPLELPAGSEHRKRGFIVQWRRRIGNLCHPR